MNIPGRVWRNPHASGVFLWTSGGEEQAVVALLGEAVAGDLELAAGVLPLPATIDGEAGGEDYLAGADLGEDDFGRGGAAAGEDEEVDGQWGGSGPGVEGGAEVEDLLALEKDAGAAALELGGLYAVLPYPLGRGEVVGEKIVFLQKRDIGPDAVEGLGAEEVGGAGGGDQVEEGGMGCLVEGYLRGKGDVAAP